MGSQILRRKMFPDGLIIELDGIAEERTADVDEIAKPMRARPNELDHRQQPRARRIVVGVRPETCIAHERSNARKDLFAWQSGNVLLIEPVKLLLIEDGIATADPLERE